MDSDTATISLSAFFRLGFFISSRQVAIISEAPAVTTFLMEKILNDNYQGSETALLTTMMEMVIQGVSTRKVTNVVEELCGVSFSKSTVSELCKQLDESINQFRNRHLKAAYPFIFVDAKYLKVRENHRIVSKAFMVAMGITTDGQREIIGFDTYDNESEEAWTKFLSSLKDRGLTDVNIITSDSHSGLIAGLKKVFPEVAWQRCQYHFQRNILCEAPKKFQAGLQTELREMFTAKTMKEEGKFVTKSLAITRMLLLRPWKYWIMGLRTL